MPSQWNGSTEAGDVLLPSDSTDLLARLVLGTDKLHMSVVYGDRDTDRATFNLGDSPAVSIVRAACD